MYCSSSPVPSVATTRACVSPRVNSAEPWVRGRRPTCERMERTVWRSRPSMRAPVSRMELRTTLAWAALKASASAWAGNWAVTLGRRQRRHHLLLGGVERGVALGLGADRIGGADVALDLGQHRGLDRRRIGGVEVARLARGLLGQADDGLDHGLEAGVTRHHGLEHHLFGQLLGFRFDHQHGVARARHDEVERGGLELVDRRVELELVLDEADAGRPHGTHEGDARDGQRGGGRHHGEDVGVILHVVRQDRHDDLGVEPVPFREQGTDRPVDEPGDQRLLLGRAPLALEVAARDTAGREGLLLVVDRQGEEVLPRLGGLGRHDGGEDGGLAVGGEHRPVGLAGDPARLEDELAPGPIDLFAIHFEHVRLSWRADVSAMSKTARGWPRLSEDAAPAAGGRASHPSKSGPPRDPVGTGRGRSGIAAAPGDPAMTTLAGRAGRRPHAAASQGLSGSPPPRGKRAGRRGRRRRQRRMPRRSMMAR